MSSNTSTIVLLQTTPTQNFTLNPPCSNVTHLTIQNISLAGVTSVGNTFVLSSSDFATNRADQVSQYNTAAGGNFPFPIGWVQANPLPTFTNQLPVIPIPLDVPRTLNSLLLSFGSDGALTFVDFKAVWRLTCYHRAC